MTDVQKPVEETKATTAGETGLVAAPSTTTAPSVPTAAITAEAGVVGDKKGTVLDTAAPATTSDQAAPVETAVESQPVTEGVLGYKAPGLVKSLIYSKKFFWIGDQAVPHTDLHQYLRGEKPEVAHHNAAWASQTGRGLLFFAKHKEHRQMPGGIINLADISELAKEGTVEFHFKLHGQKHSLQAATQTERDGWIASIENAAAEAKATAGAITGGSGYKEHLEKLGKPTVGTLPVAATKVEGSTPKKSIDKAPEAVKRDDASSSSSSSGTGAKKNKRKKSRSVSRKRGSIFGSLLGKKEEHDEKKVERKEEKADDKPTIPAVTETKKEETPLTTVESPAKESETIAPPLDPVAVAARVVAQPVVPVEGGQPEPPAKDEPVVAQPVHTEQTTSATTRDAPKKRNSIFGSLFQRKDTASPVEEKKEKEVIPPVPVKDNEAPTMTPAVPPPGSADSSAPTTTEASHTAPKDKSNSLPKEGFLGKFIKHEKAKHQEKKDEKASETATSDPAQATTVTAEPPASGPRNTDKAEGTSPVSPAGESGNAHNTTKDKRRSSFFGALGTKREKKPEVATEAEHAEGETKQKNTSTSPLPKLGGLFRKPSRAAKTHLGTGKDDSKAAEGQTSAETSAVPNQETAPSVPGENATTTTTSGVSEPQNVLGANGAIGDVVPAAITVGQPPRERTSPEVPATA